MTPECSGFEIDCNDDTVGALSSVDLMAEAGMMYLIVLEAQTELESGNYTLNINLL
jgi:hypothetical protein